MILAIKIIEKIVTTNSIPFYTLTHNNLEQKVSNILFIFFFNKTIFTFFYKYKTNSNKNIKSGNLINIKINLYINASND